MDGEAGGGIATALGSLLRGVPIEGREALLAAEGEPNPSPIAPGLLDVVPAIPPSFGLGVLKGEVMPVGPVEDELDTLRVGLALPPIFRGSSVFGFPVLSCFAVI
jgi:hypothetical protein